MKRGFALVSAAIALSVLAAPSLAGQGVAASTGETSLLVLSKRSELLSTDGRTAFISNYGYGAFHTITPVDLAARRALPVIDTGVLLGPHGLSFVQGQLWFTAEIAKAVARYNPASRTIEEIVGLGQNRTHMLYVAPDSSLIVTSNVNSGTISLLTRQPIPMPPGTPPAGAPRTEWTETVIPVGHRPEGFDVSPFRKEIWVGNGADGTISIIDIASRQVAATLPAQLDGVVRLRFTPDGRYVLLASLHEPFLAVYDASSRKEIKRIPIAPGGGGGMLVQPDGARAFVSCSKDNFVAVVDLTSMTVVGHIQAGTEPDGLAWATRP